MIKAVIFDMDGLLIDSEPHWRNAEIVIFGRLGLTLTEDQCMQTMGMRIDEVVKYWYERHPWSNCTLLDVETEIVQAVEDLVLTEGTAMEGVAQTLDFFRQQRLRVALASSSKLRLIHSVLNKLNIRQHFEVIHSAEFEEYGKPHPAIFLSTARQLTVPPTQCLVFEDSFNGLISAKAARMKTVAVPEGEAFSQTRFDIADLKLRSLREFTAEHFKMLDQLP
jgi:mannitol-1-/sugar-/sorbitol-6-/2-deoxyglucose-6-phosphatase